MRQRRLIVGLALAVVTLIPSLVAPGTERRRPVRRTAAFANPGPVAILGWQDDAMEPFLTRDGRFLLFNNSNDPSVDTNLHYAERVDDTTFVYRGEIGGVNTPALEGVASMDVDGTIYFVSTRSYTSTLSTLYRGYFSDGEVTGVELVPGVSRFEPGIVNFDAEISAEGDVLYFVDGRFSGASVPDTADLVVAVRQGSGFERVDDKVIMASVNTDDLEYAPAVSADGRELFFTRLVMLQGTPTFGIWRAWRSEVGEPFGLPSRVMAIEGFVEAPTLSPDERSLYFHKRENERFVIFRVTR